MTSTTMSHDHCEQSPIHSPIRVQLPTSSDSITQPNESPSSIPLRFSPTPTFVRVHRDDFVDSHSRRGSFTVASPSSGSTGGSVAPPPFTRPVSLRGRKSLSKILATTTEHGGSFSLTTNSGEHSTNDSPLTSPHFHPDPEARTPTSTSSISHRSSLSINHIPSLVLPTITTASESSAASTVAASSNPSEPTPLSLNHSRSSGELPSSNPLIDAIMPPMAASSSLVRPLHFHSSLPESIHNPLIMLERFRATSGEIIKGLDEDEIKLEEMEARLASPTDELGSPTEQLSPRSDAYSHSSNAPIPITYPNGHFTSTSWSWKHIDYVEEHHAMIHDFFQAIETHSSVYVKRLTEPVEPEPKLLPKLELTARHARRASDTTGSQLKQAFAAASSSPLKGTRMDLSLLPPLVSTRKGSAQSSSPSSNSPPNSTGHSGAVSPALSPMSAPPFETMPPPTYAPDFVPHQLTSLSMTAQKELLRKTKIVSGPLLGANNPTEKLLTILLMKNGAAEVDKSSSARGSGGVTSRFRNSNASPTLASSSSHAKTSNIIPNLQSLDIRMGIQGITLADGLKRNQTLTHLGLSHNVISEEGCNAICRNLHQHPTLKSLDLSQNILYPASAAALRDLFLYNRTLSHLDVSVNKLGSDGLGTLMEAFGASKQNRTIMRELVAKLHAGTPINSIPIVSSATPTTTAASPSLTRPSTASSSATSPSLGPVNRVSSPALPVAGASRRSSAPLDAAIVTPLIAPTPTTPNQPTFLPAFSINQSLTSLDLSNNKIGSEIDAVCSALVCSNSQLRDLNLGLNDIGDTGANYLALTLKHPNCPLRSLNIGDNIIGPLGCKTIMASLESNTTLTRLDLGWNAIGQSGLDAGPKSIGKLLTINTTLKELILNSNHIGDSGLRAIMNGWMERIQKGDAGLELLDLSKNEFSGDAVKSIATVISHPSCPLNTLLLNGCSLVDEGVTNLIVAFPFSHLRRLSLLENGMHPEACGALLDAYAQSPHLIEIHMEDSPCIARDEALGQQYRRVRSNHFARLIEDATDLPMVLGNLIAEYHIDLRKKTYKPAQPVPAAAARPEDNVA